MLLTIAIPSHNSDVSLVDSAISSIVSEECFGNDVNIIISDNSLSDHTKKLYESKYSFNKSINYFDSKDYNSLDENVNRAVELSDGDYVWIFGDDDLIVPGILTKILEFIRQESPELMILNSKSFKKGRIIEDSRVKKNTKLFYGLNDNDIFLKNLGGYLTYVACILVKKDLWIENFNPKHIGSFFAHIDCIASIKTKSIAYYFSNPSIQMRIGSQTWTKKSFVIWNFYYPDLIWGLNGFSNQSKESVVKRKPCNSFSSMLSKRAYGSLNINIWLQIIFSSSQILLPFKVFSFLICLIPRRFFVFAYKLFIILFRRDQTLVFSPKLALATLD